MKAKSVICGRDIGEIGEKNYCSKDIEIPNALGWCNDCLKRLPIWPVNDDVGGEG